MPGVGVGAVYKYHIVSRSSGYRVDKADPFAVRARGAAAHRLGRRGTSTTRGRDAKWMAPRAERQTPRAPIVDLRGAPRLLAARPEERRPVAHLPRARRRARRLRARDGLHARRAPAGDGAPVLRLVGLPGDGLLRADRRYGTPQDFMYLVDTLHQRGHRRDPRLGAVALPVRRARPRLLRRHAPLRARRPAPGLPPGLEELHLQLRPQRGAQLPALVRRCSGSTATTPTACAWTRSPRCSTSTTRARRASGSRTSTAAARTSRRSRSCAG